MLAMVPVRELRARAPDFTKLLPVIFFRFLRRILSCKWSVNHAAEAHSHSWAEWVGKSTLARTRVSSSVHGLMTDEFRVRFCLAGIGRRAKVNIEVALRIDDERIRAATMTSSIARSSTPWPGATAACASFTR
jgi:hypothetical protein